MPVEGRNDIELRVVLGSAKPVQCLPNEGNWVSILHRDRIGGSVVHAEA
jgi:hypothetical protein